MGTTNGTPSNNKLSTEPAGPTGVLVRLGGVRLGGWLLLGGSLLAFGAVSFPALTPVWSAGAVQRLELISGLQRSWVASSILFTAGFAVSFLGLAALTGELTQRVPGSGAWVGLAAYGMAVAMWLMTGAFRLAVTAPLSAEVGSGLPVPDWYEVWAQWSELLAHGYVLLASIALVSFGAALLPASLRPTWSGWALLGYGALLLLLMAVMRGGIPILPQLGIALLGVVALIEGL